MNPTPRRTTYHHGDLRATLLREAVAAVREGGVAALSLRDVTRRAGVAANAAYRHFADRDDLLLAVTFHGQARCAELIGERLVAAGGDATGGGLPGLVMLAEVGLGYIAFARAEPGLFEAAFLEPVDLALALDPRAAGPAGLTPYGLLVAALDRMVADGGLPAERRPGAEIPCWSAVHGFAMLTVRGPLRGVPAADVDALAQRVAMGAIVGVRSV